MRGGDIDLSNATGKMVATILASVQVQESEHHSERRKLKYVQQAATGDYDNHGHRTFGYTRDGQPLRARGDHAPRRRQLTCWRAAACAASPACGTRPA